MGLISWLRNNWSGVRGAEEPSLVQEQGQDSPQTEEVKQAAAQDVAEIEQDDKYFAAGSPANEDAE